MGETRQVAEPFLPFRRTKFWYAGSVDPTDVLLDSGCILVRAIPSMSHMKLVMMLYGSLRQDEQTIFVAGNSSATKLIDFRPVQGGGR